MNYRYQTSGTCSRAIDIDVAPDGTINDIRFYGGCNGNTSGISALAKGMKCSDLIQRLRGIRCGNKITSCPDQLAIALEQIAASLATDVKQTTTPQQSANA